MTPILETKALSKWYGDVIALNDVSFEVPGGLTGLLGPNGAGKTTLLSLCTGQLRPSKGQLRLLGEDPWDNPGLYRRVGFVPETTKLWDWMKGRDHTAFAARLHGVPKGKALQLADAALEQVRLSDASHRAVGGYSRGMRQRLKIAMGLLHEPEVLLLDEPFTGLDPMGRRAMMDLLRDIVKDGRHVLFSSHVLHEVEALTKTIVVLVAGHVVAVGDVHEIRSLMDRHPHHVRVVVDQPRKLAQALMGEAGVVRVRIDEGANEVELETHAPEVFYGRLQEMLLQNKYQVRELTSPDDNLHAVFRYLTRAGGRV